MIETGICTGGARHHCSELVAKGEKIVFFKQS